MIPRRTSPGGRALATTSFVCLVLHAPAWGQDSDGQHGTARNNLAVPLVFAEGIGLLGVEVAEDTGLRPRPGEQVPMLPFFNPADLYVADGLAYYLQQSSSVWQAGWRAGGDAPESAAIEWSRNLLSHRWSPEARVNLGIVLPIELAIPMLSYPMVRLFGHGPTAVWGTTGTADLSSAATAFSAAATLTIEKISGPGGEAVPGRPALQTAVYEQFGDAAGPAAGLVGRVSRCGKVGYRYQWSLRDWAGPAEEKLGWWRLTFSLAAPARYELDTGSGVRRMHVKRNLRLSGVVIGTHEDETHDDEEVLFMPRMHGPFKSTLEIEIVGHGETHEDGEESCGGGDHQSAP